MVPLSLRITFIWDIHYHFCLHSEFRGFWYTAKLTHSPEEPHTEAPHQVLLIRRKALHVYKTFNCSGVIHFPTFFGPFVSSFSLVLKLECYLLVAGSTNITSSLNEIVLGVCCLVAKLISNGEIWIANFFYFKYSAEGLWGFLAIRIVLIEHQCLEGCPHHTTPHHTYTHKILAIVFFLPSTEQPHN